MCMNQCGGICVINGSHQLCHTKPDVSSAILAYLQVKRQPLRHPQPSECSPDISYGYDWPLRTVPEDKAGWQT